MSHTLESIGLQPHLVCEGAAISVANRFLWGGVIHSTSTDQEFRIFLIL